MNVRVLDERGELVAEGRNLDALREKVGGPRPAEVVTPGKSPWRRDGLKAWEWDDLPEQVDLDRGGLTLTRFPAVVDAGTSVALRLCDTLAEAEAATWRGLSRLIVLDRPRELREQVEWLPQLGRVQALAAPLCREQTLQQQLIDCLAQRMLELALPAWGKLPPAPAIGPIPPLPPPPRTKARFLALLQAAREQLLPAVQQQTKLVTPLFDGYHQVRLALEQLRPPTWKFAMDDLREQFTELFPPQFLTTIPFTWLQHYPRYLKAMAARLQKLGSGGLPKDKQQFAQLEPHWRRYLTRREQHRKQHLHDPELEYYRWMIEEFRVSLFAQELGAQIAISQQRLDKQWAAVRG
jgi:ATP-dependent helicase HrpA